MVLLSWKTRKGKSKRNFGWKFWGRGLEKRGFCRKSCRNLHKGSLEYLFKAGQRMTRRWIIHKLHMGLRNVQILTNLIPWGVEKTPHKGPAQPVEPNCAACAKSLHMSDSLQPYGLWPPASSVYGILQARILESGCHVLLQVIFLIRGLNLQLPRCKWILYGWATSESQD